MLYNGEGGGRVYPEEEVEEEEVEEEEEDSYSLKQEWREEE